MKTRILYLFSFVLLFACEKEQSDGSNSNEPIIEEPMKYLALGDSYTIGESVSEELRYPNQVVETMNKEGDQTWSPAKIIAKTGWTVDELEAGIDEETLLDEPYDLVTLLIGVNNQFRGRAVEEFKVDFENILLRAIGFSGGLQNHVIVLSIPDWGITPFAINRNSDQEQIALEIDAYNQACKEISEKYGVYYIDITEDYRAVGGQPEMLAEDGLHPSGKVYTRWTQKLIERIEEINF